MVPKQKVVTFDRGIIKTCDPLIPQNLSGSMASFDEEFHRFAACMFGLTCFLQHCFIVPSSCVGGEGEQSDPIYPFHAIHDFVDYHIFPKSSLFQSEIPGPDQSFFTDKLFKTFGSLLFLLRLYENFGL